MIKLLLYDLDGTLVDTREDIALSANHMLSMMGHEPISHDEIASYVGRGVHHLIGGCLKTAESKVIEKGIKIYRTHYAEHMLDHSRLFPGAKEMLEAFSHRVQSVITNKPNPYSKDMLTSLGVAGYFREIIAGNSEYEKKPSPQAVFALMRKYSANPEEVFFIGDSLVDIETAKNAGVAVGVVTHGFSSTSELESAAPALMAGNLIELLEKMKTYDKRG